MSKLDCPLRTVRVNGLCAIPPEKSKLSQMECNKRNYFGLRNLIFGKSSRLKIAKESKLNLFF